MKAVKFLVPAYNINWSGNFPIIIHCSRNQPSYCASIW